MAHFRAFCGPLGAIAQLGERLVRNEEVGGSIPPGSTSLRRFAATAGKPLVTHRRLNRRGVAKRRRLPVEARLAKTGWQATLHAQVAQRIRRREAAEAVA
jgi:hypothetical protein